MCEFCRYGYIDHTDGPATRQARDEIEATEERREYSDKNTGILGAAMKWSNLGREQG